MARSNYKIYNAIEVLSKRISTLADKDKIYTSYINPVIRHEGIQLNLPSLISRLLVNSNEPMKTTLKEVKRL